MHPEKRRGDGCYCFCIFAPWQVEKGAYALGMVGLSPCIWPYGGSLALPGQVFVLQLSQRRRRDEGRHKATRTKRGIKATPKGSCLSHPPSHLFVPQTSDPRDEHRQVVVFRADLDLFVEPSQWARVTHSLLSSQAAICSAQCCFRDRRRRTHRRHRTHRTHRRRRRLRRQDGQGGHMGRERDHPVGPKQALACRGGMRATTQQSGSMLDEIKRRCSAATGRSHVDSIAPHGSQLATREGQRRWNDLLACLVSSFRSAKHNSQAQARQVGTCGARRVGPHPLCTVQSPSPPDRRTSLSTIVVTDPAEPRALVGGSLQDPVAVDLYLSSTT